MLTLTKTLDTTFRAEPGERAVVARISTTAVDRDGDVILPSGLDVADYKRNPVVLLVHDSGKLPIGRVESIKKQSNDVMAKVVFAERPISHPASAEWIPDTVLALFQQKVLNAFSVGFTVDNDGIRIAEAKDKSRFGDHARRIVTRWKLIELSVVPVPANQEALAVAVSKSWLAMGWKGLSKKTPLRLNKPQPLVLDLLRPLDISLA